MTKGQVINKKLFKHATLLDEEERNNLEKLAIIHNLNMSDIIRMLIKKEIKKYNKEK